MPPRTDTPLLPPMVVQVSYTPSATASPSRTPRPSVTPSPTFALEVLALTVTATPLPTASPTVVAEAVETDPEEDTVDGQVLEERGGLRLRRLPTTDSTVLLNLPAGTDLNIMGRSADNNWVLVEIPEGFTGWVWTDYVDLYVALDGIPAIANPEPEPYFEVSPPPDAQNPGAGGLVVTGGAREIYLQGQQLGNRRNVFTKVGDSISASPYSLKQFVWGYDLGDFGYLLPALQFFSAENLGDGNSFNHSSMAAVNSWITFYVLDPTYAPADRCQPGETPLACEYRVIRPAVSLIMIGTNDSPAFPASTYRENMRQIIEISIEHGVIPVLSTLPSRIDFDHKIAEYNQVLVSLSQSYDVPLWDYAAVMNPLPNRGMGLDGIHPSIPPSPADVTTFRGDPLNYGYTVRNLTALQMLDILWRQVMY